MITDQEKYRIRPPQRSSFTVKPNEGGYSLFFHEAPTEIHGYPMVHESVEAIDAALAARGLYRSANNMVYVKDDES